MSYIIITIKSCEELNIVKVKYTTLHTLRWSDGNPVIPAFYYSISSWKSNLTYYT